MTMQLPQELIDEILDYLGDDKYSLRTRPPVCRAWVLRTRACLFESCCLSRERHVGFGEVLQSPNCTFLHHVRSMWATRGFGQKNDDSFNDFAAHLPRLLGLRELELLIRKISVGLNGDPSFRTGFFAGFSHVRRLVLVCKWDSQGGARTAHRHDMPLPRLGRTGDPPEVRRCSPISRHCCAVVVNAQQCRGLHGIRPLAAP
ncbi:hypothetical protein B0H14DRAFT_1388714 [Mycena olivaceomarginata]|nr:hypothetical protein B0H14DRAFT_1388714 [Mycena olivaceomarginata]